MAVLPLYGGMQRLLCFHALSYDRLGERSVIRTGAESKSGPQPDGGEGIWRCLWLKELSNVELLDLPWQSEPHARQGCVEDIEIDAEDYPGDDPQNGQ